MKPRTLAILLLSFTAVLVILCLLLHNRIALDQTQDPTGIRIVSLWRGGERVQRLVIKGNAQSALPEVCSNCTLIVEAIVDQAPLLGRDPFLMSISLVPGRDGLKVQMGERTIYMTPLDLLHTQVNRGKKRFGRINLQMGFDDIYQIIDLAAKELDIDRSTLLSQARFERFVVRREDDAAKSWPQKIGPKDVTFQRLKRSIESAAQYLASTVRGDGSFVYEIDARNGQTSSDYSWPRHAGATYFLAEAAHFTGNKNLMHAALRAAYRIRYDATLDCGPYSCIGENMLPGLGATALTLLAYVELERHGLLEVSFMPEIKALAAFLRSMQRSDGEFMHIYDRAKRSPIDVQFMYYTGEAAFALARAHRLTHNAKDLEAANAALSYLVQKAWNFFGSRYFFGSEHWTCQALDELWNRIPNQQALRFCLDFHAFNRLGQFDADNPLGPYDGGFNANPFFPPRITATSARTEAAVATLATAVRAGIERSDIAALDNQIRRSLAFIMRYQFLPGPTYLFENPKLVYGGVMGSPIDWAIRNDFPQHAGSAMIRFAQYLRARRK